MDQWFTSVKAEAERERRMREQSSARLALMQERVELLHKQFVEVQRENKMLRERVADLSAVHDVDEDGPHDGGRPRSASGASVTPSISTVGFGSNSARTPSHAPLASVRGGLGAYNF